MHCGDVHHFSKVAKIMMTSQLSLIFFSHVFLLVFGYAAATSSLAQNIPRKYDTVFLNRSSFPAGFIFGTGSAAYQFEGAWNEGGRGVSLWDTYTHKYPEKITDGSNGDVAADQYHRYKEDVGIMKEMNTDAYRFSISWSRLLPNGTINGGVNKEGVKYYNNLINELLAKGLTPFVTIFHWDTPQTLEDQYGGFLSPHIVNHLKDYADLCFKEFGDRVKHWITINEPSIYAKNGYVSGVFAPGRCSAWQNANCTGGDSGTEPYIVAHHLILSHAAAVKVYREKYQASQKGSIGITTVSDWYVPYSDARHNVNAAKRSVDFSLGWILDPLVYGHYPHTMRVLVGNRLPKFTEKESQLVKGSYDFLGINYYTSNYAAYSPSHNNLQVSYNTDSRANATAVRNGVPIGTQASGSSWLHVYPQGLYDLLMYTRTKYNNPLIYVTENGVSEKNDPTLSLKQALNDTHRIDYHFKHLTKLSEAIRDGVNVKGYFAWSFLDNFEWSWGKTSRFGIYYVDFNNGQKRYPKLSSHWFKKFLKK